jgi:predicted NAD/FAD-dependent oxidoreductase
LPSKVGIIGAGIAGLTLATRLREAGHEAVCFDKGRGVGGRMSTRRTESTSFDHGAQYFTARDPRFRLFLDTHLSADHWALWNGRFGLLNHGMIEPETRLEPRYVGVPGMSSIARELATRLEVKVETRIVEIAGEPGLWTLIDANGARFGSFDWVVSTAPPVQTAAIFEGRTAITESIGSVRMRPCFALMIIPPNGEIFPFDGIRAKHPILGWLANNHSKPGRAPEPSLVIHSNHEWAEAHVDDPLADVARSLSLAASEACGIDLSSSKVVATHRWLYARPVEPLGKEFVIDFDQHLAACGDWCQAAKVEGAFLSGLATAETLIEREAR